jgi:O-acetyl-ADP-ribose deacetylase (regulator of RNase III)
MEIQINSTKLVLGHGNIMETNADALVFDGTPELVFVGKLGLDLIRSAKNDIQQEADKIGHLETGECGLIPTSGINFNNIIYMALHEFSDRLTAGLIDKGIKNSLAMADSQEIKTVAIPPIPYRMRGYTPEVVAELQKDTLMEYCSGDTGITTIFLIIPDARIFRIFKKKFAEINTESK